MNESPAPTVSATSVAGAATVATVSGRVVPVARGEIQINDERIAITVTREANVYDYMAGAV